MPTTLITDFREYLFGMLPSDFFTMWRIGSFYVEGAGEYDAGQYQALVATGADFGQSIGAVAWIPTNTTGSIEVLIRMRMSFRGSNSGGPALSLSGIVGSECGYYLDLDIAGGILNLKQLKYGVETIIGSTALVVPFIDQYPVMSSFWFANLQLVGTALRFRGWVDSTATPAWNLFAISDPIPGGFAGFVQASSLNVSEISVMSVAQGTLVAGASYCLTSVPTTTRLLDTIDDASIELENTIEIEMLSIASGAIERRFFSNKARTCDSTDYPSNYDMQPFISGAGVITSGFSGDDVFSAGEQAGTSTITLDAAGTNGLDFLVNMSLSGRTLIHRIGAASALSHRTFEVVRSYIMDGNPTKSGSQVTINCKQVDERLSDNIRINKYYGTPTALSSITATGSATGPVSALYNLSYFAIVLNFNSPTIPLVITHLMIKELGGNTNRNFAISITTAGFVKLTASISGVANSILISNSTNICDGLNHTVAASVDGAEEAFLIVDGDFISSLIPNGLVDTQAASVVMLSPIGGMLFDARLYQSSFSIPQLIAISAMIVDSSDFNLVAQWMFNDGLGGIATDYTSNANHAIIGGTVNVDYTWVPTLEGEAQQAGKEMPAIDGLPYNVLLEKCDNGRNIFKLNDRTLPYGVPSLRARGYPLVNITDYVDIGHGCYQMVAPQSEPVTATIGPPISGQDSSPIPSLALSVLTSRTGFSSPLNIDVEEFSATARLLPYRSGIKLEQKAISAILNDILGGAGALYKLDRHARLSLGYVTPPVNPCPYGLEPAIEHLGHTRGGVAFPNLSLGSTSYSITGWVKLYQPVNIAGTPIKSGDAFSPTIPIGGTIVSCWEPNFGFILGQSTTNVGALTLYQEGSTSFVISTPGGAIKPAKWTFFSVTVDGTSRLMKFYIGKSSTATLVSSVNVVTLFPPNFSSTQRLNIGNKLVGCVKNLRIDNVVLTQAQIQTQMSTPDTYASIPSSVVHYSKMDEGYGSTTKEARGAIGIIASSRWVPREIFDLTVLSAPSLIDRRMKPAFSVEVDFNTNENPLNDADILGTVTSGDKMNLKRKTLSVPYYSSAVRKKYLDAREVIMASKLQLRQDAMALLSDIINRYAEWRLVADILNAGRRVLTIRLLDEVWVFANRVGWTQGVAMRCIRLSADTTDLNNSSIGLWGGDGPVGGSLLVQEPGDRLLLSGTDTLKLGS